MLVTSSEFSHKVQQQSQGQDAWAAAAAAAPLRCGMAQPASGRTELRKAICYSTRHTVDP